MEPNLSRNEPQTGRRWPQMRPGWPIDVETGSEKATNVPRSLSYKAQVAQHGPKMAPRRPQMV